MLYVSLSVYIFFDMLSAYLQGAYLLCRKCSTHFPVLIPNTRPNTSLQATESLTLLCTVEEAERWCKAALMLWLRCPQESTMACTAARDAKVSSRGPSAKISPTRVETTKSARLTSASGTAASTVATRSAWPWA